MMYEFLDRLISIAIPRIRDFRGLNTDSFDKGGNYSFGLNEQVIFAEVDVDKVMKTHGMAPAQAVWQTFPVSFLDQQPMEATEFLRGFRSDAASSLFV